MDARGSTAKKPRGFAALTPERRNEISRKGGVTAHLKGSAHEWDSTAAREAGRKGGLSAGAHRKAMAASTLDTAAVRPPPPLSPTPPVNDVSR